MNNENFRAEETDNEKDFVQTPRSSELSAVQKRVSKNSKTSRVSSIVETLKSEAGVRDFSKFFKTRYTGNGQKPENFYVFLNFNFFLKVQICIAPQTGCMSSYFLIE